MHCMSWICRACSGAVKCIHGVYCSTSAGVPYLKPQYPGPVSLSPQPCARCLRRRAALAGAYGGSRAARPGERGGPQGAITRSRPRGFPPPRAPAPPSLPRAASSELDSEGNEDEGSDPDRSPSKGCDPDHSPSEGPIPGDGDACRRAGALRRSSGSAGGPRAGSRGTPEGLSDKDFPEGLGGGGSGGLSATNGPVALAARHIAGNDAAANDGPAPGSEPPCKRTKRSVAAPRAHAPGAGAAARAPDQAPDQVLAVPHDAGEAGDASDRSPGSGPGGERDACGGSGSSSSSEEESEFQPSSAGPGSSGRASARPQRARRPSIKARPLTLCNLGFQGLVCRSAALASGWVSARAQRLRPPSVKARSLIL